MLPSRVPARLAVLTGIGLLVAACNTSPETGSAQSATPPNPQVEAPESPAGSGSQNAIDLDSNGVAEPGSDPSVDPATSGLAPEPGQPGDGPMPVDGSGIEPHSPLDPVSGVLPMVDEELGLTAARCQTPPPGWACVPGGWFTRGIDVDPHECDMMGMPRDRVPSAVPSARVWVDTFYMHMNEVTYGSYHACMDAEACEEVRTIYRDHRRDEQPMTGQSWFDSMQYCEAVGGSLPTEAQWEMASGGPESELNTFGNEPVTCDNAVVMNDEGRSCGVTQSGDHPERGRVLEVGSRPAGRFGLYDMAGNAEEWVFDWWGSDYASCGDSCLGVNPLGPCDGAVECDGYEERAVRGGSWYWPADHATSRHRRRHYPSNEPYHHFGFRCAIAADQVNGAGGF